MSSPIPPGDGWVPPGHAGPGAATATGPSPVGAVATGDPAAAGRIHDIGYRHYEGARLGRGYVLRSLYTHNLRGVYGLGRPAKSKIFPILLSVFMLVPAAGSIAIVAISGQNRFLIPYSSYAVALQLLVAIFLAAQSPVIAARELRSHTVPLYFSRPVGFLDYALAKYAALTSAVFLLLAAPVTLLYAGALVTKVPHPANQTGHYLLGLVGCALFALVLGALGLLVAAFAPRRGFGVAAIMVVYLLSSALAGIIQTIAFRQGNDNLAGWVGLFTPFSLVDTVQMTLLDGYQTARLSSLGPLAGAVALLVCAALVGGSLTLLYARFRKAGR